MNNYIPFSYNPDYHDEIMQAIDDSNDLVHQLALDLKRQQEQS